MRRLSALLLCAAGILWAAFDAKQWQFRRPVDPGSAARVVRLKPDASLYKGSRSELADVRVVHDGVEIPYVVDTLRPDLQLREVPARVVNQEAVPGRGLQLTLEKQDTGAHNLVTLKTSKRDFRQRVQTETSEDGKQWAVVRTDGVIYDVSKGAQPASSLAVDYPVSTRRYVRVTIEGWDDPKAVEAASLMHLNTAKETRETVFTYTPGKIEQDPKTQSTVLDLNLGSAGLPQDAVSFEIGPGLFSRKVEVYTSTNGTDWEFAVGGVLARVPDHESLTISFSERWNQYLRVRILDQDDHPLPVRKVSVQGVVRYIRWAAQPGRYWLYYGNDAAHAPVYDTVALASESPALDVTAGPEQPNPDYTEPAKPFSDRSPKLLYSILVLAIAAMGYVTVRFLMKVKAPESQGPG